MKNVSSTEGSPNKGGGGGGGLGTCSAPTENLDI